MRFLLIVWIKIDICIEKQASSTAACLQAIAFIVISVQRVWFSVLNFFETKQLTLYKEQLMI